MCAASKGLWGSMVALWDVVSRAITSNASQPGTPEALDAANELEMALQRNRTTFISLLKNPPKNASERSTLQHAISEPVPLPGFSMPTKLPEAFVQEALIISDMFDLSEMSAFSLLRSAEEEKTLYPGVPRGLVAVLFYYDSREQLANAFKTLVQARQGISWTLMPGSEDLSSSLSRYLKPILNISLMDKILEHIGSLDLVEEIDLLQTNRALGDAKHRSMVMEKFKSVRVLLAETVFAWAAQTPLKKDECKRLIAYLSKVKLTDSKDGTLGHVELALLFALLYSIESSYLLAAEDITDALSQFPITSDKSFVEELHKDIKNIEWECPGIQAVVQLAWAMSLSNLCHVGLLAQLPDLDKYYEEDEMYLDEALKKKVFSFIEKSILTDENLNLEPFFWQRLHNIFADLLYRQFDRIKAMKAKAEDNARNIMSNVNAGLVPPVSLDQPFEDLLMCLAKLYNGGQCGELVEEYWCDTVGSGSLHGHSSRQMALYRFVRLPGDFLPPPLFVPYMRFLTGIATTPKAACMLYNFLRLNNHSGAQGGNLSWEKFLSALSQYYSALRVQQPQSMHETVYRMGAGGHRRITPQEQQGLIAMLKLLRMVASQDESARIALCDNPSWSPMLLCSGLLTCSIPISLKTCLTLVLEAFAKTPSLGARVWKAIEDSGLIPPRGGTPGYTNRGLRQDIEEIESRTEEFPLSRALLKLLLALVDVEVPFQMGNRNSPGFRPSLDLVVEQIFLPHDSRTYKSVGERWALAKGCFDLFHKLLEKYRPVRGDGSQADTWNHASRLLLLEFIHDSKMLCQVLSALSDAVQVLEEYRTVPGQKDLEDCLLLLLKVLLQVQELQDTAISQEIKSDLLLVGIDKLLQSTNPRTGMCDYLLNVARIIGHHSHLPSHASYACQILTRVGSAKSGQAHLMNLLASSVSVSVQVRQNFVQLLDHSTLDEEHEEAAYSALNLLKSFLRFPGLTIAHFLLGFIDDSAVMGMGSELRSDLLEPGVRGFPRTALHAVLHSLPSLPPKLAESTHQLILSLVSNPRTSAAVLRYLSSHDFVYRSLVSVSLSVSDTPCKLLSTAWVLRVAALDLRYHSSHKQRSQLQRLISLLVNGPEPDVDTDVGNAVDPTFSWGGGGSQQGSRGILLSLLEVAELSVESPPPLECQILTRANEIISSCESMVEGIKEVNLQKLHQFLYRLIQDSGAAMPLAQRDPLKSEIQEVLEYALSLNQARRCLLAQKQFLESWRQLVEMVVAVTPAEVTETPSHQSFLYTITLELTRRLLDSMALPELTAILMSALLLLVTTLHTLHAKPLPQNDTITGQEMLVLQLPSSLQLVLRGLIDCLLKFRHSTQGVRASVYASLLNYLQIHSVDSKAPQNSFPETSLLRVPRESQEDQFHRENFDAIRDDLQQIVDILCCEAAAGHHVCRVLALACLDALAALERRSVPFSSVVNATSPLLSHLTEQGHLQRLLDGIVADDQQLLNILAESSGDLKPLYVWEARSSLLARLALSPGGAQQLLQLGLIVRMAEMKVFEYLTLPDLTSFSDTDDNQQSQVWTSVLSGTMNICMSILTSLGPQDYSASSQVVVFLASHIEVIMDSMRVPKIVTPQVLHHLALVTSVVSVAAPPSIHTNPRDLTAIQAAAQMSRLHKQLLSLLPHFLPNRAVSEVISNMPQIDDDGHSVQEVARTASLQIMSSSLAYARDQLMQGKFLSDENILVFQPTLEVQEVLKRASGLSLGILLEALEQCASLFFKVHMLKDSAMSKLSEIDTAIYDSLHQYVSSAMIMLASPTAVRKLAAAHLQFIINQQGKQEELLVHIVESGMLLLFQHLEVFLKPLATKPANAELFQPSQQKEFKSQVKKKVDGFLPRIQEMDKLYASHRGHTPFLEGCITRVRWLIAT